MPTATRSPCRLAGMTLLGMLLSLALAVPAHGYVYWTNFGSDAIGRAMLDGSAANQNFIGAPVPPINPCGVAVDGEYVYWVNQSGSAPQGKIGRAKLDGTEVDNELVTGANNPCGIAVNSTHVFWANAGIGGTTIGRANLDGTGVNHSFITGLDRPDAVAVDAEHIYWTDGTIGRANLNSTEVETDFISVGFPSGVAVDGTYVYWADVNDGIGRANLDGSSPDQSFIDEPGSDTEALAVDGSHVYWANEITDTIARANLDGSGVDLSFIEGAANPTGIAVDSLPPAVPIAVPISGLPNPSAGKLRLLRLIRDPRRGTAKLILSVSGPGVVRLAGDKKVKGATKRAKAAGTLKIPLIPTRKAKGRLLRDGRLKVVARVTFTPSEGAAVVRRWRRTLIRVSAGLR